MTHEGDAEAGSPDTDPNQTSSNLETLLREALSPTYLLGERIGEGGMGTVYLARDPVLKRSVAVKILSQELATDSEPRSRFIREAQAAARLTHPNVIPVYAVGELSDGLPYFVMRYVPGGSMADRLVVEGPLEIQEARRVIGSVAAGLEAAHDHGIVHRDVKPGNVLHDPEIDQVLVTDFGISAILERDSEADSIRLTRTGVSLGSPLYMSPEQCVGDEATPASDVYGLGLLAYELIAGSPPFPGKTPQEFIAAHLRDVPKPLSEVRDEVDSELEQLVAACLSKEPSERPAAREIVRRLLPETGSLLEWPPPGLEHLGAAARKTLRAIGAGSILWTGSLVLMSARWLEGDQIGASALAIIGMALGFLGLLTVGLSVRDIFMVGRRLTRSAALGYGWGTLLDVVADDRGDTGALIGGTLEYGELEPMVRGRLRRRRRLGFVLQSVATILPLPSMIFYVAASSGSAVSPGTLIIAALLPAALLFLCALALELWEAAVLRGARRKIRRRTLPTESLPSLLAPWHDSLRIAARGQPLSTGPSGRPILGIAGASLAAGVLVVAIFLVTPILFVGAVGTFFRGEGTPWSGRTQERFERARVVEDLILPHDSSLSVEEASDLAWSLAWTERDAEWFNPPQIPIPEGSLDVGLFRPDNPLGASYYDLAESLMRVGAQGFTPEQERWIEEATDNDIFRLFSRIARAERVDLVGARTPIPISDTETWWSLPIPRISHMRDIAYWKHVRAAYLLSIGDQAGAEEELRETISVGFLLTDQTTLIENLIGVVMVGIGRTGMIELYRVTDRAQEAERIEAELRALEEGPEPRPVPAGFSSTSDPDLTTQALIRGPEVLRGMRWEILLTEAMVQPCLSPAALISGSSAEWLETIEIARRDLIRHPGEAELFRLVDEWNQRIQHEIPDLWWARTLHSWSAVVGHILGNESLSACMALDLGLLGY